MADKPTSTLRAWLPLAIVSGAVLTAALDHTVVVTVLPEVMPDLKVPPTELDRAAWIITAYLLGFTAAIPLTARLADVHGHALLFRTSLLVFAVGSLAAAMAPNLEFLIVARTVQALGGGATIPVGMAMAVQSFPGTRRAIAVGIIGACAEAGMVLGPLYGGVITALLGWRWVFWLDVPQALILIWALRGFPVARLPNVGMDWLGGALLVSRTDAAGVRDGAAGGVRSDIAAAVRAWWARRGRRGAAGVGRAPRGEPASAAVLLPVAAGCVGAYL